MSNYDAKIIMLPKPEAHPNADRLQVFNIKGMSVITDKSYFEGDVVVYFCLESQINYVLLHHLNLFSNSARNKDQSVKGFFDNSGRVRAVKLRGVPSEGFVIKLKVFNDAILESLNIGGLAADIGYTFSSISNVEIVKKYEPPVKGEAGVYGGNKRKAKSSVIVPGHFALHCDTAPSHKADWLVPSIMVAITEKLHGCNCAVGKPLVKLELPWWKRVLNLIGAGFPTIGRAMIYASRNVIKNDIPSKEQQHYYKEDVWHEALAPHLEKEDVWPDGLTLYGEIVGVSRNGTAVQTLGGKVYDYKKLLGNRNIGFIAFRATYTREDGYVIQYSREQLEYYCRVLDIPVVPLHGYVTVPQDVNSWLKDLRAKFATGICNYCESGALREGIVLEYQYQVGDSLNPDLYWAAKLKSAEFLGKETTDLDAGISAEQNDEDKG